MSIVVSVLNAAATNAVGTPQTLSISVPAGTTAIVAATVQYTFPDGDVTITDAGRTWTFLGSNKTTDGDVWVWGWKNTTGSSVTTSTTLTWPAQTYGPLAACVVLGLTNTANPATTTFPIVRNPTGNTTATTATTTCSTAVTPATVGSQLLNLFASGAGDAIGAAATGSTYSSGAPVSIISSAGTVTTGAYWRTANESSSGSPVTVGSTVATTKVGNLAVEVPPAVVATSAGGFLAVLAKIGLGIAAAVVVGGAPASITHGDQLTVAATGPWALQGVAKGSETLTTLNPGSERISTYPGNGRPSWIPGTDYVYDNNPTNHGGVVPAGGLTIDGYTVPAGTWVVQFRNITAPIIIAGDEGGAGTSWPGVLFRGCRMRGPWVAPGWANMNAATPNGALWINYCDAGGVSQSPADYCEVIFNWGKTGTQMNILRSYLSNATTLAFASASIDAGGGASYIENFCENVTDFGDSSKHLNGLANHGGETFTLWLRNHAVIPRGSSSVTELTDVFMMSADGGTYPGNGTCLDGSTGYVFKDNLLGGGTYTVYLGVDHAITDAQVNNVKVTGNKFSTSVYSNSGQFGYAVKQPTWNVRGNVWSGNTWADGVNAGTAVAAP